MIVSKIIGQCYIKIIVINPVEIMHSDWIIAIIYFLMSPSK